MVRRKMLHSRGLSYPDGLLPPSRRNGGRPLAMALFAAATRSDVRRHPLSSGMVGQPLGRAPVNPCADSGFTSRGILRQTCLVRALRAAAVQPVR